MWVRRAFLFFVATIPLDSVVLPGLPRIVSLTAVGSLVFFGCCLLYPQVCFRRPAPAVLWFMCYLAVFLARGLFIPDELGAQMRTRFVTMTQLIVLFWVASSLLQDIGLTRKCLLVFGAATSFVAVGTILKLPGFAQVTNAGGGVRGTRLSALGMNANYAAALMGVAAIMLLGLLLDNTKRSRGRRWLLAAMTGPPLILLVATSSRGGLVSFVCGASLFLIPLAPSRRRFTAFALALLALLGLGLMLSRDPVAMTRWAQTLQEGRIAGRDAIWRQGIEMVRERPILGWGPIESYYELGSRLNLESRDPQNQVLWLLLEVGVVGSLLFYAGFALCARAAWRSRTGPEGILPLALVVAISVKDVTGVAIAVRYFWLVLAIALASPVVSARWRQAFAARAGKMARRA